ncbi:MAG TPA: hypothetical protein VF114_01125 [Candidatus Limnocylindria bacterium]
MTQPIRIVAAVAAAIVILLAFAQPYGGAPPAYAAKKTPAPTATPVPPAPVPPGLRAGLRASNYGITPFPSPSWWTSSINSMASRFSGSVPEQIAVVVEVAGGGGRNNCWAHFPQPATGSYPGVNWDDIDLFESTFDAFDAAGIKVWLQVEPARCDVSMLIGLLYQQYGHHPSVIGFGVDVEWYRKDVSRTGKAVTDEEASDWVAQTRSHAAEDLVFLKHWLIDKMPPTARDGLVFIDDSQGHGSLSAMVSEFSAWGQAFNPAPVGFQYGYQSDNAWWKTLPDPPADIGNSLLTAIPNTRDLIWVDFTAYDIWPPE